MTPDNDNMNLDVPQLDQVKLDAMITQALTHTQTTAPEPSANIMPFIRRPALHLGAGVALAACLAALLFFSPAQQSMAPINASEALEDITDIMVLETLDQLS